MGEILATRGHVQDESREVHPRRPCKTGLWLWVSVCSSLFRQHP